ncbi:hypothetical protein FPANT_8801 [Fusarium pseudoanthophilum]|uniref:Uncharacterized protein n=1 Tax=Fusarium pseudoanthophilum TaxID=48495 RepID=A0A8H5NZX6_9HYPO|nr:hypothetical protein FPANT_8801 [Fusarium pseudoanthophilum]
MDLVDETALAEAQTKKGQLVTNPYDPPSVTNTVHAIMLPSRWILLTVRVKWVKATYRNGPGRGPDEEGPACHRSLRSPFHHHHCSRSRRRPRWISSTVHLTRPLSNGSRLLKRPWLRQMKKGQLITHPYDRSLPCITNTIHAITPPATMDLVDGSFDLTSVEWVKTTMTLAEAKKGHCLRWISSTVPLTFVKWVKTTETALSEADEEGPPPQWISLTVPSTFVK